MNSTLALPGIDNSSLTQDVPEKRVRFFETLHGSVLESFIGTIELRALSKEKTNIQEFHTQLHELLKSAQDFSHQGYNVYFGINPRDGSGGTKENITHVTSFHCDLDYGSEGHKKKTRYLTQEEAYQAIKGIPMPPTAIVDTGGGFHLYWVLPEPVAVSEIGIERLEKVNRRLIEVLGGDLGTQDISRIFRVPGTVNHKYSPPLPVEIVELNDYHYDLQELEDLLKQPALQEVSSPQEILPKLNRPIRTFENGSPSFPIDILPVGDKIKNLIRFGHNQEYPSRSEADQAVIVALWQKGYKEQDIKQIFGAFPIGEKYREHNDPEAYLKKSIEKAKQFLHLNEEEILNPLLFKGIITRHGNKVKLKTDLFERHVTEKYNLYYHREEKCFYQYTGRFYLEIDTDRINCLCQQELGEEYRYLFTQSEYKGFLHFASGGNHCLGSTDSPDKRYLNLKNGLFNLDTLQLEDQTFAIFTTHHLPYAYDPMADCPLFLKTLNEIFNGDQEHIDFLQQIVGYGFHQEIQIHSLFFFKGEGNNGKSLLLNVIEQLFGSQNCCTVLLQQMQDPNYSYKLKGKMLNLVFEETCKKLHFTDRIKAIASGETVHGKRMYKDPFQFKPFAKHFIALNRFPVIEDQSAGMWRRVFILDFPRIFQPQEEDKNLFHKLQSELPGIFNWAVEGYLELKSHNFCLPEYSYLTRNKNAVRSESNVVLEFLNQNEGQWNSNSMVSFQTLWNSFEEYCHQENLPFMKKKDFKSRLQELGYRVENSSRHNNQVMVHELTPLFSK